MKLIGKLICALTKHKRGLRIHSQGERVGSATFTTTATYQANVYQCPRCGTVWTRKERKK